MNYTYVVGGISFQVFNRGIAISCPDDDNRTQTIIITAVS